MAVYLPCMAVLLSGGNLQKAIVSISVALLTVLAVLFVAIRYGKPWSRLVAHESDEIILLTTFGTVLLVAGIAEKLQVSAAIGAFLVGIAVSGPIAEQSHRMLTPLRDLFAAIFFFFFGLETDPRSLPSAALPALALGAASILAKTLTGYVAGRRAGLDPASSLRAGITLIAHGEFSIVIAGLGGNLTPQLGPLSAAYVMLLAILGPLLSRWTQPQRIPQSDKKPISSTPIRIP